MKLKLGPEKSELN